MKRLSFLKAVSIIPFSFGMLVPLFCLNSCGENKTDDSKMLDKLEEDTINEFKAMVHIPRPSDLFLYDVPDNSNCKQISNYLKQRVQELAGIVVNQDKYSNIWFDVPCNDSKYKNAPTIALQCHMDMVFAYDPEKLHDPDPMTTEIQVVDEIKDGKRVIHSKNYETSIGADNCIGISGILALISNPDIKHGNLRIIFTNCEENAMQGAMMLVDGHRNDQGEVITGQEATAPHIMQDVKYVINLDTGINKSVCVSSSGAIGSHYNQTFNWASHTLPRHFKLTVTGFVGGHSAGVPRQGYGNALKAANEVLTLLNKDVELISYTTPGTEAYNNVPSQCIIEFFSDAERNDVQNAINHVVGNHTEVGSEDYWKDMADATLYVEPLETLATHTLSKEDSNKIINLHKNLWYGFDKESYDEDRTKTSANVGPATLEYDLTLQQFKFSSSSYSRTDDEELISSFKQSNLEVATQNGLNYLCDAQFHPWARDANAKLLDLTKDAICYAINCQKDEIVESEAHGGLECTWWAYAMNNTEGITDGASTCLGINVMNEHKFTEAVDVASIKDCMKAVIYIFRNWQKLV
ncbi:MAG: hypothetical protein ACOQNV_00825 [Mycoplasmoidaceae bacterium]